MKSAIFTGMFVVLGLSAWAGENQGAAAGDKVIEQASGVVGKGPAKGQIFVGDTLLIKLSCNPTTGFDWELKSINRKIAQPQGKVEFQQAPVDKPGMLGVGGSCVLAVKGVKPGKTKVVLVYQRSWEKGQKPAETFTAEISVLAKKKP